MPSECLLNALSFPTQNPLGNAAKIPELRKPLAGPEVIRFSSRDALSRLSLVIKLFTYANFFGRPFEPRRCKSSSLGDAIPPALFQRCQSSGQSTAKSVHVVLAVDECGALLQARLVIVHRLKPWFPRFRLCKSVPHPRDRYLVQHHLLQFAWLH